MSDLTPRKIIKIVKRKYPQAKIDNSMRFIPGMEGPYIKSEDFGVNTSPRAFGKIDEMSIEPGYFQSHNVLNPIQLGIHSKTISHFNQKCGGTIVIPNNIEEDDIISAIGYAIDLSKEMEDFFQEEEEKLKDNPEEYLQENEDIFGPISERIKRKNQFRQI